MLISKNMGYYYAGGGREVMFLFRGFRRCGVAIRLNGTCLNRTGTSFFALARRLIAYGMENNFHRVSTKTAPWIFF